MAGLGRHKSSFSTGNTGTFVRTCVRGQRDIHPLGLCMSQSLQTGNVLDLKMKVLYRPVGPAEVDHWMVSVVTASQPCFCFRLFCSLFFRFSISPCVFIIHIYFASYFSVT